MLIDLFVTKISHTGVQQESVTLSGLKFDHEMRAIGYNYFKTGACSAK